MSALPQCDAFGFIYDPHGQPAEGLLVTCKKVIDADGNPLTFDPLTTSTDSEGEFHFTLPQGSTAYIAARATTFSQCNGGSPFRVPASSSGELVPAFDPETGGSLVAPPLVLAGGVLSIPRASASSDGYLSAEDFALFEGGIVAYTPVNKAGDTMLGPLFLYRSPVTDMEAATRRWVLDQIAAAIGTPDTTPPVISSVSAGSITTTGATITWTTDEPADSQVEYGLTTSYGSSTALNTSLVTSHSQPITGLTSATLYHYRVKSKDAAANLSTSSDMTFTTSGSSDTTPPVISAVSSGTPGSTTATITWTTDEPADSQVDYGTTISYGSSTMLDTTLVTSHTVTISGLTASTLYHFQVKSKDAASNPSTLGDYTFTTSAGPVDLLTSLISMWELEEASGSRADSHGTNVLTPQTAVAGVTGKLGNGAHIVGGPDYLSCPSSSSLQTGNVDYTIAFWVNLDSKIATDYFVTKTAGDSAVDEYLIGYDQPTDRFIYTVCGGSTPIYTTISASTFGSPSTGTWYLIVAWHDQTAGTINIQVNNGTVNSASRPQPMNAAGALFALGVYGPAGGGGPSNFAQAIIDEVAFWKGRVLGPGDRAALWNGGAGKPFSTW